MSLTRSASGPAGGLSINTGAANAFGASASQNTSSGGLFGSGSTTATATGTGPGTGTNTMATTGGLFGGAAKTGGLFGQPATTAPTGGLFGQAAPTAATTGTTGGGLFGNTAAANTQPAQTTTPSLFGNAAGGTSNTQQPAGGLLGAKPAMGSLFGGGAAATQQSAPASGGLFGQTAQPQQQTTGGLFGASTAQNTQANTGGGLFNQSQAKPTTGLFGQTQPQQTPVMGQSTNQVSAVQINVDSIRPRTRFDDLAKPVQDEIALLDKGIMRVIKMKDEIGEFMPQHERDIEQLGRDVKFVESKFRTVQVALNNDIQTVKALQDLTKKNAADARLCFRGADNLKLPTHYHQTGLFASTAPASDSGNADAASTHADAQDLITYFNRICDDIEKYKRRLDEYRGEIERDMPGVENGLYEQIRSVRDRSAGNAVVQDQLGEVLAALRETGNAIVAQAGQIADTRERLSRLQAGIIDTGVYAMGMAA
ncbi:hypothetical protein B0J13DRAFT_538802 [Dactylonectria estremocensis]|uniref:Nucleoporin Nup54 alpha-helical domain-containing protein n=1 Tax=Dactylonectria estremocensis TaxID=1079267 RepID=A0A9P9JLY3_9HYPO|nr:hypothetical protein B0J13DRAFT_538802 [Dactylonectria estremocensis]